jgi:hypothetical protein
VCVSHTPPPSGLPDTSGVSDSSHLHRSSWTSNATSPTCEGTSHSTPLLEEELFPFSDPYRATLEWILRFVDVQSSQNGLLLAVLIKLLSEECARKASDNRCLRCTLWRACCEPRSLAFS